MDLWIRSQDKTQLLNVIGFYYDYQQEKHHITCLIKDNDLYWVGIYKSKERALEVLDEIHNAILGIIADEVVEKQGIKKYTGRAILSKQSNNIIYEMPKE